MDTNGEAVVRRLTALVVIQAALLVVVLVAGLFAFRTYSLAHAALRNVPPDELARLTKTFERADELARQLTAQQEALARALDFRSQQTLAEIKELRRRRKDLARLKGGAISTVAYTFQATQLMADEMLLLLDHLSWSQNAIAKAVSPPDAQREATGMQGSGGSGNSAKDNQH
jgi:acetoin utilization deacetylase AcuC-like enzyme